MNQTLAERIRGCTTLPSLPAAAVSVLQLTDDDSAGMDELAKIISVDAALSARILRAVNSSFYGLQQKVTSIQQGVALLGLHAVKTLVLGFSLVANIRNHPSKGGFNHLAFWRRSMYAATAARVLASRVLNSRVEDCFVSALLMDLGCLVLDQMLGDEYSIVHERARAHTDLLILETHAFGLTHAEAGGILAEQWKLPDVLRQAIVNHHGPQAVQEFIPRKTCEVINLAGRCADVFMTDSPAETIASVRRTFLEQHQVREIECDSLLCEVGLKTAELGPLFEVRLNTNVNYDDIVSKASEKLLELSLAEQQPTGDTPVEKRRGKRIRRDGNMILTPCTQGILGRTVRVRLKDLSAGGIGVVHTAPIEKGNQFIIQLPQPGGKVKSLLYTVVRCESFGTAYSIGAELTRVLTPPEKTGTAPAGEAAPVQTTEKIRARA